MAGYSNGAPKTTERISSRTYEVASWNGDSVYTVDLNWSTCTCPDYMNRRRVDGGDCKHLKQVRATEWTRYTEIAAEQPTDALTALLPRYEQRCRWDVAWAISYELQKRQQAGNPPVC